MRIYKAFLVTITVFLLTSCGANQDVYNFTPRQDTTLVSSDKLIVINYKTDTEGKLVELNIDRLLTIEEMMLLNPIIDFEYEIEGFTGDIFIEPSNTCTDISNDVEIPVNLEVGNTRYKFNNQECMYQTVDNHNEYKPGFSDEYLLRDTIPVASHVEISIIVYNPSELVSFIEIYSLPNTYKTLGIYNVLLNRDNDGFENDLINYYNDISMFEQLYLKHQEAELTLTEVQGIATDINLMDLNSLTEVRPLIDNFEDIYSLEVLAISEFENEVGVGFEIITESIEDEPEELRCFNGYSNQENGFE